jgi:hypothetical protein
MSRRCHHGSPRHVHAARPIRRPVARGHAPDGSVGFEQQRSVEPELVETLDPASSTPPVDLPPGAAYPLRSAPPATRPSADPGRTAAPSRLDAPAPHGSGWGPQGNDREPPGNGAEPQGGRGPHADSPGAAERVATAPQLRRFIKSRAYVPMHELRRRFAINGGDDDVTAVDVDRSRVYVGLPEREGRLLGELLRGGDIGYELSLDPISPIVVGVYPMRPVSRG